MEVEGALVMWRRSEGHGMRYTTLIGDEDTKTFLALTRNQPYGADISIQKEECVNHAAKRLGTGLRNLKSSLAKKSIRIGGNAKGSLNDSKTGLLQSYYIKAVRSNNTSVEDMSLAIGAAFYQSISTDINPQHQDCPAGKESWCWYQRDLAAEIPTLSLKNRLQSTFPNEKVGQHVKDVYDRLTNPKLLSHCPLGKTQNANEALHSVIWARCPKHLWSGYRRVFVAVVLAVGDFNMGSMATHQFLSAVGCMVNDTTWQLGVRRDLKSIRGADAAQQAVEKKRRETRLLAAQKLREAMEEAEGVPS